MAFRPGDHYDFPKRDTIMIMSRLLGCSAALFVFVQPATAADYYAASRFTSPNGDGEAELLISGGTVRTNDAGNKVADVASVNAGGVGVTQYTAEFDCGAKAWRITHQTDYYIDGQMAPRNQSWRELPAFTPVNDGSPVADALAMVCNWPTSMAGIAKIEAIDPVALSRKVSPTLKFTPPADSGGR